jgi:hypothetical protein
MMKVNRFNSSLQQYQQACNVGPKKDSYFFLGGIKAHYCNKAVVRYSPTVDEQWINEPKYQASLLSLQMLGSMLCFDSTISRTKLDKVVLAGFGTREERKDSAYYL